MTDKKFAKLSIGEESYDFPIYQGTEGDPVVGIQDLYTKTGHFTFDPGFKSTANCESKITFIDGDKGILRYRGYPIEVLAEKSTFTEVAYLLKHGELPTQNALDAYETQVNNHMMLHEQMYYFIRGFRRDAHPMAIMVGMVGALSAFHHESLDMNSKEQRDGAALRLVAKMPTIAALAYKYSVGQPMIYPMPTLDYASNFLHACFSLPNKDFDVDPILSKALDKIFILHADHEQNASTSTVRLAGSSGANPYACIAAGIACLWGPAHGGANEAVLKMLTAIGDKSQIPTFIARAKDKSDPFRLMGFGHRVYKNYDPRAKIMRKTCHDVLKFLGINDPLLDIALELEHIALNDPYFIDKKLYPNIDFYSGITLRAMGFPTSMFTALFALARTAGWASQWLEMCEEQGQIGRPRQMYTGYQQRDYVDLGGRK